MSVVRVRQQVRPAAVDPGTGTRKRLSNISQSTFESIFGIVYLALMVNLMLIVSNTPLLVALAIVKDPLSFWPFFLVLSLTIAPSLAGAFSSFEGHEVTGDLTPIRAFIAGYRRSFARAQLVGVAVAVVVAVVVVDVYAVAGTALSPLLFPLLGVFLLLSLATAVNLLVGITSFPDARFGALAKASVFLAVRGWYFSLATLALLGLLVFAVSSRPLVGAVVAPGFLLFVIWNNNRYLFKNATEKADHQA